MIEIIAFYFIICFSMILFNLLYYYNRTDSDGFEQILYGRFFISLYVLKFLLSDKKYVFTWFREPNEYRPNRKDLFIGYKKREL